MSGLRPKVPASDPLMARNPGCLETQDVPPVCLRLQSRRQRLALPYALLLRAELSDDDTACALVFATHEVNVRGRHLHPVYLAVSQGQAAAISVGESAALAEGDSFVGPLVTDIRIEPLDETMRARR